MRKPLIYIINSSTFGKHFIQHLASLKAFAQVKALNLPADIEPDKLAIKIHDADGVIASVTPRFTRATLEQCKSLKLLVRHGIGCDNVDLDAASELGIIVSRVKGVIEKEAVAEFAVSLALSAVRKLAIGDRAVRQGRWPARAGMIGIELMGKNIGIIGLGNIGSRAAEIFSKGFGANVLATDPYIAKSRFYEFGAKEVSLEELIRKSKIILLHCPLTAETSRMFAKKEFAQMQPDAILVNTCRGELLDEDELYLALKNERIGGYATDVVEGEPIGAGHRLAGLENVIITPHLGGYSWESLQGMGQTCVNDMLAVFLENRLPGEIANTEVLERGRRKWH